MVHYLIFENLLSSFIYNKTVCSYFCLKGCKLGGKFDLVLFSSGLSLHLNLLECNLDFVNVLGFYKN